MSSRLSPWYAPQSAKQAKTTPKYDPDKDQGEPKFRNKPPSRPDIIAWGIRTVEDGFYVYRYHHWHGNKKKTYVAREKMTKKQYEEYVLQRWRDLNGRGQPTVVGFDPGSPDGDMTGMVGIHQNRLVIFDEAACLDPDIFK